MLISACNLWSSDVRWRFHGGENTIRDFLGCCAVQCAGSTFRRAMLPPPSEVMTSWYDMLGDPTSHWRWRQHDFPKRLYPTANTTRCPTTQKTSSWIFTAVKNVHLPLVLNFHCSSNKDTFLMVVLWFSVTLYLIQYNPVVLHVPSLLTLHPNLRTYLFSPPSSFHTCSSFLWNGNFFPTWNVRNYDIQQN
jgi:hypothetical protein